MTLAILALIIGLALLTWGADRLVVGAAAIARNYGISPLLIGLTIIAFGTSAPEIFVAISASLKGNAHIAIGNALGSNIANIGLVLGIAVLLKPMEVHSDTLRREFPIMFLIMAGAWVLLSDGVLSRVDGILLLIGLLLLMIWLVRTGLKQKNGEPLTSEFDQEIPQDTSNLIASVWVIIGLIALPAGSELIVYGAVYIAKTLGVSDLVIGLTIVAIGTSLPEVAAAIAGVMKKEFDMALGNILGSNMFNLLAVLPFPGLIKPGAIPISVLHRDMPVMIGFSIALFLFAYHYRKTRHINRWEASFLLLSYVGYLIWIAS